MYYQEFTVSIILTGLQNWFYWTGYPNTNNNILLMDVSVLKTVLRSTVSQERTTTENLQPKHDFNSCFLGIVLSTLLQYTFDNLIHVSGSRNNNRYKGVL